MAGIQIQPAQGERGEPLSQKPSLTGSAKTFLGLALVFLLAGGAATWWGLGVLEEKKADFEGLRERLSNPALASLLGETAGTDRASQEAAQIRKMTQNLQDEEGQSSRRWSRGTAEARGQGKDWSKDPGKWKDELISRQNEIQKKASTQRVKLAPDFYLGLEEFREKSPTEEEVPDLALQLSVACRLVDHLLAARQVREQYATECELKSLVRPRSKEPEKNRPAAAPPPAAGSKSPSVGPERKKFRLEYQCSPEVLYEFVRLLSADDWLFIIQDLAITNMKSEFPPRSEIAKKFSAAAGEPAGRDRLPSGKKLLEVLAGDEAIVVGMEVDFVPWQEGEAASAPTGKSPKP